MLNLLYLTGEKPFCCKVCGMAFRDPSTMRKHVKRHSSERPFSCETCGKMFASTYDMRKHARIHLNDEERPYKCEVGLDHTRVFMFDKQNLKRKIFFLDNDLKKRILYLKDIYIIFCLKF